MKGAWPKLNVQICTMKKSANGVCKSFMASFDGTILMQVIRVSGMNGTFFLGEEVPNFGVVEQFAFLVQMCTFAVTVGISLTEKVH